ncbi:uncharacterized protein LOC133740097 isoform X2 [Rosa rugosa]|uniref:uncharacterized protein LOC133712749 isoform X2 n=1 Tax=Rosa rugosa TaxID=74645 RepID=UPI002B40C6E4|nr:uncharacterized protein LOC133712749 isoform X2 [Rosa rugosa]XP_062023938.1 uncharacterized protein LOC133740097 isoform X2 [Rosa rugosa]
MEHRTQQPARLQPTTSLRQSASAVSELRLQAPVRKRSSPITCQPFSISAKNSKPPLTCFQALRRGPNDVIVKSRRDSPGLIFSRPPPRWLWNPIHLDRSKSAAGKCFTALIYRMPWIICAMLFLMNKIRQELQSYLSNGPITIVTGSQTGASRYGIIIVAVVAGYGYFWWKGWKLPDMMFATRRSLADAGKSFSKQIDGVFSSISITRRQLSSNLDGVDCNLAESIETTVRTQQEVIELQGKTDSISTDFRKVQHAVLTLETKINIIEGKQDSTNDGVWRLCDYAKRLENSRTTERIQACIELFL